MEQERRQNQLLQQEQAQTPVKCPRCDSMDTKFRYFNNHSLAQPRHYCRNCKRLWTVGGSLREIHVGGNSRNKQTKVTSSRFGEPSSQPQPPPLPSAEELHNSHYMTLMAPMVPQNLGMTGMQPLTNLPQNIASLSSLYFDNEFSNLDDVNSLIQPELMNQTVNFGNQVSGGSADITFLQDWNFQSIEEQQALPPQTPGYNNQSSNADPGMVELNQLHGEVGSYQLSNYDLVQPNWPMSLMPQETMNNFSVSTSDDFSWDNSNGNASNMRMPTTTVNPNQWPNFPVYGPP